MVELRTVSRDAVKVVAKHRKAGRKRMKRSVGRVGEVAHRTQRGIVIVEPTVNATISSCRDESPAVAQVDHRSL